jgi:putative DNA methylase
MTDDAVLAEARAILHAQFGEELPPFWDMFGGRGSIPLEAQRLGLQVTASDLNPVSVIIQRALLTYPQEFTNRTAIASDAQSLHLGGSQGLTGLVADIRAYGRSVSGAVTLKISRNYPKRSDGSQAIAWLWARTVVCPSPACHVRVPLYRTAVLSKRSGVFLKLVNVARGEAIFTTTTEQPESAPATAGGRSGHCLRCATPIPFEYIRAEGVARRIGQQLLAMVVRDASGHRRYIPGVASDQIAALAVVCPNPPEEELPEEALGFRVQGYGMTHQRDMYTGRQLEFLCTLCDEISCIRASLIADGADEDYASAVNTYLACAASRLADYHNSLATWNPTNDNVRNLFQMQTVPMAWDFAEASPLETSLSFEAACEWVVGALRHVPLDTLPARVLQLDARNDAAAFARRPVVSTDPPYYASIGYADLSDFFYVWLRRALREAQSDVLQTLLTPKAGELIMYAPRHGGSTAAARAFVRDGFDAVFRRLCKVASADVPITVYYALKEEGSSGPDTSEESVGGWEAMLSGLVGAGYQITATLPVRTSRAARARALEANALASTVILAARPRPDDARIASRREFVAALRQELPTALTGLMDAIIAPVDLAQCSIGPGMAVFSRYRAVLEGDGSRMSVGTALNIINKTLDEILTKQDGEVDPETRWAMRWFEQYGFDAGPYGDAESLARARNAPLSRLVPREELSADASAGDTATELIWRDAQQLCKAYEADGDRGAAALLVRSPGLADNARELAYRLFLISERRGLNREALAWNSLISAWPGIARLAAVDGSSTLIQPRLL